MRGLNVILNAFIGICVMIVIAVILFILMMLPMIYVMIILILFFICRGIITHGCGIIGILSIAIIYQGWLILVCLTSCEYLELMRHFDFKYLQYVIAYLKIAFPHCWSSLLLYLINPWVAHNFYWYYFSNPNTS